MAEITFGNTRINLDTIPDMNTRRVLREYHEQMMQVIERQQTEIEALLEVLITHHLTSLGEFRRQLQRMRTHTGSAERLHDALLSALGQPHFGASAPRS